MTASTSRQPFLGFWDADLIDLMFPSTTQHDPLSTQDTELLQQFGFLPGFKELLAVRQVHALEHATVWVLSGMTPSTTGDRARTAQQDNELLSGMSTDRGFYVYGRVNLDDLKRATQIALRRITSGEWDLAVHPRCGTNLSVGMLLTAGFALGASMLLPRDPIGQLIGLGLAAATANQIAPDLGSLAQRYVTTAIPFNLAIDHIKPVQDPLGRPTHFVQIRWVE